MIYLLINICTINSSRAHFAFIFRLKRVESVSLSFDKEWLMSIYYMHIEQFRQQKNSRAAFSFLTLGKNFGSTGAMAVFEGSTFTGQTPSIVPDRFKATFAPSATQLMTVSTVSRNISWPIIQKYGWGKALERYPRPQTRQKQNEEWNSGHRKHDNPRPAITK